MRRLVGLTITVSTIVLLMRFCQTPKTIPPTTEQSLTSSPQAIPPTQSTESPLPAPPHIEARKAPDPLPSPTQSQEVAPPPSASGAAEKQLLPDMSNSITYPSPVTLRKNGKTIAEMGFKREGMVNDYVKGIYCEEKSGTRSLYMDIENNHTLLFERTKEADLYIYDFPQKILHERTERGGNRYITNSYSPDHKHVFTFEALSSKNREGVASLYISEKITPTQTDRRIFFGCKEETP